jgi:hypothetical protein
VLSGKPAGKWIPRKGFERGSMHFLVDEGLRHFHDRLRDAEDGGAELPAKKKHEKHEKAENDKPKPPRPKKRKRREKPRR